MVLTTPQEIIEQASTQSLLDDLIDECTRSTARKPIMLQFDPSSAYIWRRWKGTVFSETWRCCVFNMVLAAALFLIARLIPGLRNVLNGFDIMWGQLLSVTTFTLTFFLNQAYALWRKCYALSRRLQGRLNDLGLTLSAHAKRLSPEKEDESSRHTPESRQLLALIARYVRLFNLLTYASFARSHRPLLTPRGMERLVERGLITNLERDALASADVPAAQRHNAVIMWIVRCFLEGRKGGLFEGGHGFEQQFMEKIHVIRSVYGAVSDELQGRMPLAYAHIVQVLVDVVLWMYPLMALSKEMSPLIGVLGTGVLTMSYQGLFDLAKQFLDPYDNENYGRGDDPMCVDTLVAETNAGSVRWMNSFEKMPFSAQRIQKGNLDIYQLPTRGYTVDFLVQREEERRQKEMKKKKEAKEAEQKKVKQAKLEKEKKRQKKAAAAAAKTTTTATKKTRESMGRLEPNSTFVKKIVSSPLFAFENDYGMTSKEGLMEEEDEYDDLGLVSSSEPLMTDLPLVSNPAHSNGSNRKIIQELQTTNQTAELRSLDTRTVTLSHNATANVTSRAAPSLTKSPKVVSSTNTSTHQKVHNAKRPPVQASVKPKKPKKQSPPKATETNVPLPGEEVPLVVGTRKMVNQTKANSPVIGGDIPK